MTHIKHGLFPEHVPDPESNASTTRQVQPMNNLLRMALVFHVIVLIWAWFLLVDLIQSDLYSPYYQYVQISEIRTVLYILLFFYTVYLLYWVCFFVLFRARSLYSKASQTYVAMGWVTLVVVLKVLEVLIRSGHYYGEVKDKHGDWGIVLILIYPILWLVYYLAGRGRKPESLAEDATSRRPK